MGKVRMYHAASNRFQYDAAENFEAFYQSAGWVLAEDEPELVAAEVAPTNPRPDDEVPPAEPPKRGARAK